jgi:hypothetical protein
MKKTVESLEATFSEICRSSVPYEWDENHLTFLLMKELRNLFTSRVISFGDWFKIVDWRSFKNRGKQETKYGDIALIVTVQFSSGETLQGVACIEAKRSYPSGNFESVKVEQLDRIFLNLPYSHLLLYHHDKQTLQQKFPDAAKWSSHFWISPINTVRHIFNQTDAGNNWRVLRTSFPFSMFLTGRIFWGFDLDFREGILNDILSGENNLLNPDFLGVINVYYEHQQPVVISLPDKWEGM